MHATTRVFFLSRMEARKKGNKKSASFVLHILHAHHYSCYVILCAVLLPLPSYIYFLFRAFFWLRVFLEEKKALSRNMLSGPNPCSPNHVYP